MRRYLFTIVLLVVIVLAGCKAIDAALGYNHDTGQVSPNAPIDTVEEVAPVVDGLTGGPWGEIAVIGVTALSGLYLAVRRIQRRLATRNGPIELAASAKKKAGGGKAS